ncbi:MAG: hypothetical protein CVU21_22390 [Betaproteobacteria bacterium HGW-Betaproteobacteria-15]|nr:MAG: hypothetical protein CVU21_22390 [Betaproteobacteria bacterium HGW-Betaproteobacteria-15]
MRKRRRRTRYCLGARLLGGSIMLTGSMAHPLCWGHVVASWGHRRELQAQPTRHIRSKGSPVELVMTFT